MASPALYMLSGDGKILCSGLTLAESLHLLKVLRDQLPSTTFGLLIDRRRGATKCLVN
jgi:hypothetical protein